MGALGLDSNNEEDVGQNHGPHLVDSDDDDRIDHGCEGSEGFPAIDVDFDSNGKGHNVRSIPNQT